MAECFCGQQNNQFETDVCAAQIIIPRQLIELFGEDSMVLYHYASAVYRLPSRKGLGDDDEAHQVRSIIRNDEAILIKLSTHNRLSRNF